MASQRASQYIYLAVVNDRLETPLYVTDTAQEMADFLNCSLDSLHSRISKQRRGVRAEKKVTAIKVYSFRKEEDDE